MTSPVTPPPRRSPVSISTGSPDPSPPRTPTSTISSPDSSPPRRAKLRSVGRNLWWFVLPALAFYIFAVVAPTIQGLGLSFTDWKSSSRLRPFIGLRNYIQAIRGASGSAALHTFLIALVAMVLNNLGGLLLALVLHRHVHGRNLLRTLIFAPGIVSPLVVGFLFKYIFGPPQVGAVNQVFEILGWNQLDWLGASGFALWIIILVLAWQFIGQQMVIYLAGLEGVPPEQLEAAALDGAGAIRQFWYVIRPLLAPAITVNLMLSLIGGLKIFDQILAMTNGGPAGTTETLSTAIYKQFSYGAFGKAVAMAVLLAIGVAVLSIIQFSALRRQEGQS